MARVTVEDCLEHIDTNYLLVLKASKRARALEQGAQALVDEEGDKPTVIALRELAENITPESVAAKKAEDALNEVPTEQTEETAQEEVKSPSLFR
ncbi:MAG TPA: DNA-directed RNA polymerase subunit omega [Leucothrix mucor]|uniref:DNA-directed RNA polymerase subunit omega n=1 Tax=Leucothrix mucor TaxID=45248 RepID=A0A7V2SY93_LEUMU|nr:DNA-directed RNA polymerase subunit omega [Leucothrix mucor]